MTEPMKRNYHSTHLLDMCEHKLLLEEFLVKKSDINIRDNEGKNALYWAIKNQSIRNTSILLKYKIDLMVSSELHALFHAVESQNLSALIALLKEGLDINMQNTTGQTLLMKALEVESIMMVRYLVNHGADLDIMDEEYNMAIDYAKLCKNSDVYNLIYYKLLYEELKIEQKDCIGCEFAQSSCNEMKEF